MQTETLIGIVLALPLILYLPGALVYRLALGVQPGASGGETLERLFARVFASVLLSGWTAFALAELGLFSIQLLWGLLAIFCAACLGALFARGDLRLPPRVPWRRPRWYELALVLELAVAAVLFFQPSEMIRGELDSGVYVNAGVNIARTGGIVSEDPLLAELSRPEEDQLLLGLNPSRYTLTRWRIPGFYVLDKQEGLVLPQLYHLLPSWIAVWTSALGLRAGLYVTPFILLLSTGLVFLVARRVFGPVVAALGTLFLLANSVQIWFARYPTSEALNQLLFWGMFFAFVLFLEAESSRDTRAARFYGALAGIAFGQIMLVRPDFFFFLPVAVVYALYLRLFRRWRREHWFFFAPVIILAAHAGLHIVFFTYPYTRDLYHHIIRKAGWWLWWEAPLAALIIGGLVALDRFPAAIARGGRRLVAHWHLVGTLAAAVLVLYVGYAYLVRPGILSLDLLSRAVTSPGLLAAYIGAPVPRGSSANFVRLGWYLSPLGVALSIAGLALVMRRRPDEKTILFAGAGAVFLFLYVNETYTVQHYIYTMRRYIPVVLPALSLSAAVALVALARWQRFRPYSLAASVLLAGGLLAFFAYTGRVIVPHVEYRGAIAQMESLAGRFGPDDVLLFSDGRDPPYVVATPLRYIYGLNAFSLKYDEPRDDVVEALVARWQKQGREVFIIGGTNAGKVSFTNMELREVAEWSMDVPEFEQLFDQKPMNTYRSALYFGIYRPQPKTAGQGTPAGSVLVDVGGFDYRYLAAGFYEKEQDPDGTVYRWTGPEALIRLPEGWKGGGRLLMRAGSGSKERPRPAEVTLFLGDVKIGGWQVDEGFDTYALELPETAVGEDTVLRLLSTSWSPSENGLSYDRRSLGLKLDWVRLE